MQQKMFITYTLRIIKHQDEMEKIKDINKWQDTHAHGSEDLVLQT